MSDSESHDDEMPYKIGSITKVPADTEFEVISKILNLSDLQARKLVEGAGGLESNSEKRQYYAFEGRNRLKTFLPSEILCMPHLGYGMDWFRTQGHLVVNT